MKSGLIKLLDKYGGVTIQHLSQHWITEVLKIEFYSFCLQWKCVKTRLLLKCSGNESHSSNVANIFSCFPAEVQGVKWLTYRAWLPRGQTREGRSTNVRGYRRRKHKGNLSNIPGRASWEKKELRTLQQPRSEEAARTAQTCRWGQLTAGIWTQLGAVKAGKCSTEVRHTHKIDFRGVGTELELFQKRLLSDVDSP